MTRRVQFHETDLAGLVHFSIFFRYMEEAEHALWRAAGEKLNEGAWIDLDGLPSGLGGAIAISGLLNDLQSRQFLMWERNNAGLRLADASAPLAKFAIDWNALDARRRGELDKLETMQRYAYAKACRRI